MTTRTIEPGPARGALVAPPSKSYTHRALVAAASLGKALEIRHPLDSEDTRATRRALLRLGYPVEVRRTEWRVGRRPERPGDSRASRDVLVDCGESGTTLRFVTALAARDGRPVRLTGSPRLGTRPIDGLLTSLGELGVTTRKVRGPPWAVRIQGPLHPGTVQVPAFETSQFASALLIGLAGLSTPSEVVPDGPIVSRPYLTATLRLLQRLGARSQPRQRGWAVGGAPGRAPAHWSVPGDLSSAAYLWTAAAVSGGDVRTDGLDLDWPQADQAMLGVLRDSGADVELHRRWIRVRGRATRAFTVNLDDAPDLLPLAAALAATIPARSRILGARHAARKESDRRAASVALVRALGARGTLSPTHLDVTGTATPRPLSGFRSPDHRLVASAAVGALAATGRSRLPHSESVAKSYPGLWHDLATLGVDVGSDR